MQTVYFIQREKINKTFFNKVIKSFYEKDKVFYKPYDGREDDNIFDNDKVKVPFHTPFHEQKKDIDRSSAFYRIKGPFGLVHAHVTNICFFQSLQLILAIVYYMLIFFHRKFMFTQ